jgi:predicted ATPase/transcriptional regulator with XRE-family HTH domain
VNRPDSETLDVDRGAFGPLLRRFRLAANMSQEELAERARLSVESVSALERGRRRAPYRETIRMLADALRLADSQREELIVAARRSKSGGTLTFDGAAPGSDAALVSNLPIPTTTLIGRDRERGALRTLVTKSRLVTIVGAGGMGKTRLAIDVARHVSDEDRIESRFVDLSPMRDASLVAIHVNAAIGGAAGSPQSAIDAIVKRIGVARMLLVIDNCEHVIDDIARVCDVILSACPNLRILTTSREPLQISGETAFRLASLDVPAAGSLTPDHVRALSSVQLFLERVHACNPELQLSDDLMIDVGAICRRLDGIPLAIELAAAQAQILSVPEFRHQLNETFNVLTAGKRSALPRQQTLHALIAWSFDLLSEIERTLLLRMSVFAGGCTLDAVMHVCTSSDVHTSDAVRTLTMLVQKSLVWT